MDVHQNEALEILQSAFWVNPDDYLKEFKTKYRKWLLRGNHPDTGGSCQNSFGNFMQIGKNNRYFIVRTSFIEGEQAITENYGFSGR